jgi:tetratricopeptide (TPR) repeat protein
MSNTRARGRRRPPRAQTIGVTHTTRVVASTDVQDRDSRQPSPVRTGVVLTAFAAVFIGLSVHAYTQTSATWDEPIHVTAGYAGWVKQDFRVDPSHPPFVRLWATLPTLLLDDVSMGDVPADGRPTLTWLADAYQFAHRFMYVDNDADRLLYLGRFMIVVLGVVLGVFLFLWSREWLGFTPAVIALACYTFEPNLSAHASLVTTDLGVTCFIFGTVYFSWLLSRRFSVRRMAGLIVCFSLALVSKFSALLLVPVVLVLLAMSAVRGRELTPRRTCATVAALAIASVSVIWASYGFRYLPAPATTAAMSLQGTSLVAADPIIGTAVGWIDGYHLLPNAYTQGFLYTYSSVQRLPAFLAGRVSDEGWWSYFPIAFLLKTPTVLILLVAVGLVTLFLRRREVGLHTTAFIVLPVVTFLGVAMWTGINVGLRHVLPAYPFVILLTALTATQLARLPTRARVTVLAAVATLWAGEYVATYPHTLTFFNYPAGGPQSGYRYLADSNLGWGQGLKALKVWMDQNDVKHVNLAYFGQADPAYYGIDCTHLPGAPSFAVQSITRPKLPGYVAISATTLTGVYAPPPWRLFYAAFRDLEPVAIVGNSIRLYWVENWPETNGSLAEGTPAVQRELADALLFGFLWPEHAVVHYSQYLSASAGDIDALVNYGRALAASDRVAEGIAALRRAVAADAHHATARLALGQALFASRDLRGAAEHADRAVALSPLAADAHYLIGRIHVVQGRLDDAARDFDRVLELQPEHADAREFLRRITDAQGPRPRRTVTAAAGR